MTAFVIDRTIEIDAPLPVVWSVITDMGRYPEWNPFQIECQTSFRAGEPIDMQVQLGKRVQRQREYVIEYVPDKRFSYRMKPAPLGALHSFRSHEVEALGPGRTRYRSFFKLDGWAKGVVLGLMQEALESGFAGMTAGIQRRAVELHRRR